MNASMGPPAETPSRKKSNPQSQTQTQALAQQTPSCSLKTPSQLGKLTSTPGEQLSSTPIINFEKIESQKENVQPLSRGRSAHALSKTFSIQQRERQAKLNQERAEFESLIQKTKSDNLTISEEEELRRLNYLDDSLELYLDYIKWCSDSYPSGQSNESGLVPLLERTTREFYGKEKYRNDTRYLRIWFLYADNVENSNEIHSFLFANEIGTGLASLYEVAAVGHESRQRYDEADATYRLGIARRVENLDRLKRRYSDFKSRIVQMQSESNSSLLFPNNQSESAQTYTQALKKAMAQSNRSLLGTKVLGATGRGESKSLSSNSIRNLGGLGGLKGLASTSSSASASDRTHSNGAKLNVFHDGDDERNMASSSSSKLPWSGIGTKNSRSVENKQAVSKMNGSIIKAKNPSTPGGGRKLEVFKDSDDEGEEEEGDQGKLEDHSIANVSTSSNHVDVFKSNKSLTETDKLRRNPFLNWSEELLSKSETEGNEKKINEKSIAEESQKDSKKRSFNSKDKEKEKEKDPKRKKSATSNASSSKPSTSSKGQERYAFPLQSLYPGVDVELISAGKKQGKVGRSNEVSMDELYCMRKGYPIFDQEDPWEYLDEAEKVEKVLEGPGQEQQREDRSEVPEPVESEQEPQHHQQPPEIPTIDSSSPKVAVKKERTMKKKRKERQQEMTSRSEFVSDTIRHKMNDPTEGMKKAMEDVQEMFNGGSNDDEDSDSDDSDSESEEEEKEEMDKMDRLMLSSKPNRMMDHFNGEIPPTPTPLTRGGPFQSHGSTSNLPALTFRNNDENGGIQATPARITSSSSLKPTPFGSSRKPFGGSTGGLGATPMRVVSAPTNLFGQQQGTTDQSRNPSSVPSAKGLSVLKDEEDEEEQEQEREGEGEREGQEAEPRERRPIQTAPILLPRPSGGARRVIADVDEDEESSSESSDESEGEEHRQGEGEEEEGGYQHFRALSPITERTEHSKWTVASKTPGKTPASNKTSTSSIPIKEEDEDEGEDEDGQDRIESQNQKLGNGIQKEVLLNRKSRLEMDEDEQSFESSRGMDPTGKDYSTRYAATGFQGRIEADLTEGLTIESVNQDEQDHDTEGDDEEEGEEVSQYEMVKRNQGQRSTSQKNSPQIPNPCCATSSSVISKIFSQLSLPLESSSDFVDLSSESARGKLSNLQKMAKEINRKSVGNSSSASRINSSRSSQSWSLEINGCRFSIKEKLGEGGYGAVFLARDLDNAAPPRRKIIGGVNGDSSFEKDLENLEIDSSVLNDSNEEEDEEEIEKKKLVAIKVESPPNKWEFYILGQLRLRLRESQILDSIISARKLFCYKDESFLLLEFCHQGTLLQVVNSASNSASANSALQVGSASVAGSGGVEEHLAIFFIIELMKLVEALHQVNIIHGDIKIDNCLLRLQDAPIGQTWSNSYTRDGSDGWSSKGLTLIDFGRAIDLNRFPKGQTFISDWETDEKDCNEMREGRPWTYETDYFGIASVAYCLLFGRYLNVLKDDQGKYKINSSLRRYWQVGIWKRFFEILLNPKDQGQELPITNQLRDIREEMEDWLEINCNKSGKNLKGQLRKLEKWALK